MKQDFSFIHHSSILNSKTNTENFEQKLNAESEKRKFHTFHVFGWFSRISHSILIAFRISDKPILRRRNLQIPKQCYVFGNAYYFIDLMLQFATVFLFFFAKTKKKNMKKKFPRKVPTNRFALKITFIVVFTFLTFKTRMTTSLSLLSKNNTKPGKQPWS